MPAKVDPSIRAISFSCPHCGAHTSQSWFAVCPFQLEHGTHSYAPPGHDMRLPVLPVDQTSPPERLGRDAVPQFMSWKDRYLQREPFVLETQPPYRALYAKLALENCHASLCYSCKKWSLWIHERLVYPSDKSGPPPNSDMPEEAAAIFQEARSIVDLSPRAAAALLRLALERLLTILELKEPGETLDKALGKLSKAGLHENTRKAMDVVRVTGNDAIHEGTIDLMDDSFVATTLFGILNEITEHLVSRPKRTAELYERIPENKRKGIEARDRSGRS